MHDWPPHCPRGHPLLPGKAHYGGFTMCFECRVPGDGHHYVYCGTCEARLWLGHIGAVWETWDGYDWTPAGN
jgi:hypothetical protein